MPSADIRTMTSTTNANPTISSEFIKDVEGLVMEIKENLRLSSTMKAMPCSHISRKSSRASPYRIPTKYNCCDNCNCKSGAKRRGRMQPQDTQEDPYELLQKLLRDGSLVNEAVRRVQLGLSPKQRYFYESDEESSPVLRV